MIINVDLRRLLIAVKTYEPILLSNNVRPHTTNQPKTFLSTVNFNILRHPLYSPDTASNNFHLFRSVQLFLAERVLNEAVKIFLNYFFASITAGLHYSNVTKLENLCEELWFVHHLLKFRKFSYNLFFLSYLMLSGILSLPVKSQKFC